MNLSQREREKEKEILYIARGKKLVNIVAWCLSSWVNQASNTGPDLRGQSWPAEYLYYGKVNGSFTQYLSSRREGPSLGILLPGNEKRNRKLASTKTFSYHLQREFNVLVRQIQHVTFWFVVKCFIREISLNKIIKFSAKLTQHQIPRQIKFLNAKCATDLRGKRVNTVWKFC